MTEQTHQIHNPSLSIKQRRKKDALALAELIYDMYKEEQASGKIINGQNNAQHISAN
ncbi:MAG TPA: hypothetical protein VNE40_03710 [Candidatus Dormibacteraeota bacterium]|nr:hypothetical protein [Candidatus Dormibacteraeota bacterium]